MGTFQANRLLKDAKAASVMFQAIMLDAVTGIQDAGIAIGDQFGAFMESVIPVAREIEEGRIELEKFLTAAHDFSAVQQEVTELGLSFGFAADEAFAASARMAQLSGVMGPGTMGVGTKLGMEFGLISGMSTEAAMQRMINLQQQTHFMTKGIAENASEQERQNQIRANSIKVLDQLNTVENRSAATMEQITYVMNQFASQAHLTGQSIASMAAMSAVLIEAGEEQGKGGRALRMIYARLGANTNGAADAFHNLGIATKDADGNLRDFSDIMKDLNKIYPDLTSAERTRLAQQVAGNRHYTRFLKLSENYNRVLELEFEALMRLSPALEEIQRRRDTDLFQLQEAEARLKNYTGAIGYGLMPALTQATNRHADFNKELAILVGGDGILGAGIGQMFAFGSEMRDLIGPMVNLMVNMQSLNVAFQTQQTIMRALNQEEIVNQNAYGNKNQVLQSHTSLMFQLNSLITEHSKRLEYNTLAAKHGVELTKDQIEAELLLQSSLHETNRQLKGKILGQNLTATSTKRDIDNINLQIQALRREEQQLRKIAQAEKLRHSLLGKRPEEGTGDKRKRAYRESALAVKEFDDSLEQAKQAELALSNHIIDTTPIINKYETQLDSLNSTLRDTNRQTNALGLQQEKTSESINNSMNKLGMSQTITMQNDQELRTERIKAAAIEASLMQKLSTNFMMAGSAAMMFGRGQTSMRVGMLLNIAGMVTMFRQMQLNAVESGKSIMLNMQETLSLFGLAKAKEVNVIATNKVTLSRYQESVIIYQQIGLIQGIIGARSLETITEIKNNAVKKAKLIIETGIIATTSALITATYIKIKAFMAERIAMIKNITISGVVNTMNTIKAATFSAVGGAAIFAAAGITAAGKAAVVAFAPYILLIAAGLALVKVLEALGVWDTSIPDFASESSDLNMYKASTEDLIEALKDETLTIEGLTASLADLAAERKTLANQDSAAADERIAQIDKVMSKEQMLVDILTARMYDKDNLPDISAALTKNAIEEYEDGLSWWERNMPSLAEDVTIGDATFSTSNNAIKDYTKQFESFAEKYPELAKMIDEANITTEEGVLSLLESLQMGADALTSAEMNMLGAMVDGYTEADEALQNFNNTREELFYGFSSDKLTGNLVKQVVQQGVETLITTTEVIMSNTFNGMTTTQAANQILDEIERGAGLRGMNLSNA